MSSQIAPHVWLPEPQLSFHPDRSSDRDVHPLRGLAQVRAPFERPCARADSRCDACHRPGNHTASTRSYASFIPASSRSSGASTFRNGRGSRPCSVFTCEPPEVAATLNLTAISSRHLTPHQPRRRSSPTPLFALSRVSKPDATTSTSFYLPDPLGSRVRRWPGGRLRPPRPHQGHHRSSPPSRSDRP